MRGEPTFRQMTMPSRTKLRKFASLGWSGSSTTVTRQPAMRRASFRQKSVNCSTAWSFGKPSGALRAPPEPKTIVVSPTSSARRHAVSA